MMLSGNKLLYLFFLASTAAHTLLMLGYGDDQDQGKQSRYQRPLVVQLSQVSDKQGVKQKQTHTQTQRKQQTLPKTRPEKARRLSSLSPDILALENSSASVSRHKRRKLSARVKRNPRKPAKQNDSRRGKNNSAKPLRNSRPPLYGYGSLLNPGPKYPYRAIKHGFEGRVLVLARVRSNGKVRSTSIVRSSGYAILDREARNTIQRWVFSPALKLGKPVEDEIVVPVRFKLDTLKPR